MILNFQIEDNSYIFKRETSWYGDGTLISFLMVNVVSDKRKFEKIYSKIKIVLTHFGKREKLNVFVRNFI